MIDHDDYAVRLLDLPTDVGGFITESPDGFLNIYINARHSRDQQRRSLRHELRHADADDLHSSDPVSIIEARADGEADRAKALPCLMKASDLLPPPPKPEPPKLSPHQASVLLGAIVDLDTWLFRESYDY